MKQLIKEFKEFLQEYKVIGLAIAFVIGTAATKLVSTTVDSVIMPILTPFIPGGAWQTAILKIPLWGTSAINIAWGSFISALINFIIIAWFVFLVAKYVLKEEKVTKK
jgi:large conductance mechanosensitive channel